MLSRSFTNEQQSPSTLGQLDRPHLACGRALDLYRLCFCAVHLPPGVELVVDVLANGRSDRFQSDAWVTKQQTPPRLHRHKDWPRRISSSARYVLLTRERWPSFRTRSNSPCEMD